MNRRDLFRLGAAAGFASVAGVRPGHLQAGPSGEVPVIKGQARNVIFLAYDGTGYEDLAVADFFARRVEGRPLRFHELMARGQGGVMVPSSLTSWVTDSAAATSAWATGRKIVNGALSMYPDGNELTTILDLARDRGMRTGLVSSARVTHATPAGWVAKVSHRDMEDAIAEQYLASGTDVILGGGQGPFDPSVRFDRRDLLGEFRAAGYGVVTTEEELAASNASRLLGVFTPAMRHLPYEIDRRHRGESAPSLATLTRAALQRLEDAPSGFVLHVEAGRIDHANHNNDPGGMVLDWMAADETLGALLDFVDARQDTLLIFACDHDTGGGVAFGWGTGYRHADPGLLALGRSRASHEWILREALPQDPTPGDVRSVVEEFLGVVLDEDQAMEIAAIRSGADGPRVRWGHRNAHGGGATIQIAQILTMSPTGVPDRPGISFATGNHTAGFVPMALYGAGVGTGSLGIVDNTALFRVMTDTLGLDFENPTMTEEEARRISEGG